MEFACKVSGAKLILVLGHEHCGAVKAAIDNVELGNITALLEKIKPAVDDVVYEGERTSKNLDFVHMVYSICINASFSNISSNFFFFHIIF